MEGKDLNTLRSDLDGQTDRWIDGWLEASVSVPITSLESLEGKMCWERFINSRSRGMLPYL